MIRKAILKDVNSIEDTYNEHFQYELNHTAFTVFKKGVYPTKDDAERAIYAGALFVYCLLYTSPSPRDMRRSRMPSSA